jgi:UDP-glucose 4-epimerase
MQKAAGYYENNVSGTLVLLQAMRRANVKNFLFSSSATSMAIRNRCRSRGLTTLQATNPYGQSKLTVELMVKDFAAQPPIGR